jgi:hypothetical protein
LDPDPTFQMVSNPSRIFLILFSINFILAFTFCNCVRLHITTRY